MKSRSNEEIALAEYKTLGAQMVSSSDDGERMRIFKRWYRMRAYLLGRWLMQRYQKPLAFEVDSHYTDTDVGAAMCSMLARRPHYERIKVDPDKVLELVEGQPGEMVEPPHMSMVHLGPTEEIPS